MREATKTNATIVADKKINYNENSNHKKPPTSKGKKKLFKGSPMNIIKVALYKLRKKRDKTDKKQMSPSLSAVTNTTLTNLVGTIRPLHLQGGVGDMSPPPPPPLQKLPGWEVVELMGSRDARPEASPHHPKYASSSASSRSSSSVGGMSSRYASAQSLYDLDNHDDDEEENDDEEEDGDAYYDGIQGDEMIDSKADVFIAKFYQQMRLQNLN